MTVATHRDGDSVVLLVSLCMVATCAITYELLIGTVSSYYLGSSVLHFSLTIGLFMFFLGVGAFISKFVRKTELETFIGIELVLGIVGISCVLLLQIAFAMTEQYYLVALLLLGTVATLCGLEVPLLTRLIHRQQGLSQTLAHALSVDYVGGLIGSVLFPIVLLPVLGTLKTSCVVGLANLGVALLVIWHFRHSLARAYLLVAVCLAGAIVGIGELVWAERLVSVFEQAVYDDEIIFADQSPYQRIVLTKHRDDLRLYLNGDLQFSSRDEYRYHEPLIHIPMQLASAHTNILLLGGGDGLAAREILSYDDVGKVTVVDLDQKVTALARSHTLLRQLNHDSFGDPRVQVIHEDAWRFVRETSETYDVIVADLPDANDFSLGKLYSQEFYEQVRKLVKPGGIFVTQAASPYFTREAFWCIARTVAAAFPFTAPFHNTLPSFGSWGYVVASPSRPIEVSSLVLPPRLRYLKPAVLPTLFAFDGDTASLPGDINRLDNQLLVQLYAAGWEQVN